MSQKKSRRSYTEEFKRNVVKMTLKPGIKVQDLAEELGIAAQYLSKWRSEYLEKLNVDQAEARIDARAENEKLRDEVKRLRMRNEVLKKAAVFFASQK